MVCSIIATISAGSLYNPNRRLCKKFRIKAFAISKNAEHLAYIKF